MVRMLLVGRTTLNKIDCSLSLSLSLSLVTGHGIESTHKRDVGAAAPSARKVSALVEAQFSEHTARHGLMKQYETKKQGVPQGNGAVFRGGDTLSPLKSNSVPRGIENKSGSERALRLLQYPFTAPGGCRRC